MATTRLATGGFLPTEITSFVGRREELDKAKRLLGESRLVTLTGSGGTGKTRLAVQVAAEARRTFPNGVWFIDLTTLQTPGMLGQNPLDPDVLAYAVQTALGLRAQGGEAPLRQLAGQVAGWQVLLVLDNCEHMLPACAMLVDALLRAGPQLKILATSREPLAVTGEVLFPVPPLPTPALERGTGPAEVARHAAVALFVARAQAAKSDFALTIHNQAAVIEVCRRLDGLPLAIELAALRVRVLSPQQILERLADRFALPAGWRGSPPRQQTLRACVDWSFELCAKPERVLWARLAVFVGGCELDAVEEVCADELVPAEDLLELVAGLVDKSVLTRDDQGGPVARYRMLETLHDFGREKLVEAGEDAQLGRRHHEWCQQLVDRAHGEWISDRQTSWLGRLAREHPNLRAAVEHCLTQPGQAERAVRLVVSLPLMYWWVRGQYGEGRRWLDRALAQTSQATSLRARALLLNSYLAGYQGDIDTGGRLLDEGEDLARRLDTPVDLAFALLIRGIYAGLRNDLRAAIDLLDQGLAVAKAAPEPDPELYLHLLIGVVIYAGTDGDSDRANACYREMMEITEPRGEAFYRSNALSAAGRTAWRQGRFPEATSQLRKGTRLKRDLADRSGIALNTEILAWVAAGGQQSERAATLLGIADALFTDLGVPMSSFGHNAGPHDACQRQARAALGDAAFDAAVHRGRTMPYESALDYALDEGPQPTASSSQPAPQPLTRREREIADLVAQGLSNKGIAARLVISVRTVESHVEHILTKLGFTNRAQVAAWAAAEQSDQRARRTG